MSKYVTTTLLLTLLFALVSCSSPLINGKASKNEEKAKNQIVSVEKASSAHSNRRLELVGEYSYGLSITTNLSTTAKTLNDRILTLAIYPSIEKMVEMQELVSSLNNSNHILLIQKDAEIHRLQDVSKSIERDKEKAVNDYIKIADKAAGQADATTEELKEYQGWFGLKAVGKGLWQFAKSCMWFIGIGGVLFFILRIASMSNPVAASIFTIFNLMGSWVVNAIKVIFPKAMSMAGFVATKTYDATRATLVKVVDAVETAKLKGTDVSSIKDDAAKTMDTEHKDIISSVKKELNY